MSQPRLPRSSGSFLKAWLQVDTITTRFLMLFVFALAVPLLSLVVFTKSVFQQVVEQTTHDEIQLSSQALQQLFKEHHQAVRLLISSEAVRHPENSARLKELCSLQTGAYCFKVSHSSGSQNNAGVSSFIRPLFNLSEPDLSASSKGTKTLPAISSSGFEHYFNPAAFQPSVLQNLSGVSVSSFFKQWQGQLYHCFFLDSAFKAAPQTDPQQEGIIVALPVEASFFNRLYKIFPSLKSQLLVLPEGPSGSSSFTAKPLLATGGTVVINTLLTPANLQKLASERRLEPYLQVFEEESYWVQQTSYSDEQDKAVARSFHLLPFSTHQKLMTLFNNGLSFILIAGLSISCALALLLSRTITRPLFMLIEQITMLSKQGHWMQGSNVLFSTQGVREISLLSRGFNQMLQSLRAEAKKRDEFVATLTHDLKVPLLAEKQTLAYWRQGMYGEVNEEQQELLTVLFNSNEGNLSLVNNLLEVYRYESGHVRLHPEYVALTPLVTETLAALQPLSQEKSQHVSLHFQVAQPQVFADSVAIRRVLYNLLSNAICNTPRYGNICCQVLDEAACVQLWNTNSPPNPLPFLTPCLNTSEKTTALHTTGLLEASSGGGSYEHSTLENPVSLPHQLMVCIQDSGIGFNAEDLPELFQQFSANRGRNPMSLGLGLYNAYQVITAHQGQLWVNTTEGIGSTVCFTLPLHPPVTSDRRHNSDRRRAPDSDNRPDRR